MKPVLETPPIRATRLREEAIVIDSALSRRIRRGLIVATGHGTLGVTLAPVTAELVTNILIN